MIRFVRGERVIWDYEHQIGRNRFGRVKHGTFHHDCKKGDTLTGIVAVQFDGNKTFSYIPASELMREPTK